MNDLPKHSILIAEDDTMTRTILVIHLQSAGYAVDTAIDGTEAMSKLRACRYDLMFCDIQMPGETGMDILAWLDSVGNSMPVVAITGFTDAKTLSELKRFACCSVLNKPFWPDELIATAERLIGKT